MFAFTPTPEFYNEMANRLLEPLIKRFEAATASDASKDAEILFTVKEAADKLKMCPKTVLSKIDSGLLKAANVGSWERPQYRVSKADLIAFYNFTRTK
jgi:hypothetical protein